MINLEIAFSDQHTCLMNATTAEQPLGMQPRCTYMLRNDVGDSKTIAGDSCIATLQTLTLPG